MASPSRSALVGAAILTGMFVGVAVPVAASNDGRPVITDDFDRRGPDEVSPSGQTVNADCPGAVEANGWPEASAELRIRQLGRSSDVVVRVRDARPETFYTVWLRLGGTDSNGDQFGFNPVTDGRATPLAASDTLDELLTTTGPGNGSDDQPNGFWTDDDGDAVLRTAVDFPIVGGAYPFHRFPGFDPTDPRLPAANPAVHPVAIAGPQGPYTLRIVSHCTDEVGHGLTSGPREWWFDWTVQE